MPKRKTSKHKNRKKSKQKSQSIKSKKIKDVNFSNKINKGTGASQGEIEYHYQNYSNVMNFL